MVFLGKYTSHMDAMGMGSYLTEYVELFHHVNLTAKVQECPALVLDHLSQNSQKFKTALWSRL